MPQGYHGIWTGVGTYNPWILGYYRLAQQGIRTNECFLMNLPPKGTTDDAGNWPPHFAQIQPSVSHGSVLRNEYIYGYSFDVLGRVLEVIGRKSLDKAC